MNLTVDIQSGLELLEFELLPDKNDSENLDRELNWLENQKRNMFNILERMESLRASTEGLTELMSVKMIGFAIIGLLSIIVVNFMFYKELKKTFKERKLIWCKTKRKNQFIWMVGIWYELFGSDIFFK